MEPRQKSRRRKIIEQGFLFLVVVLIFYLIFRRVKFREVLAALRSVELARFVALNIIFVWTVLLIDAVAHFVLFKYYKFGIGFKEMFKLRLASLLFIALGFIYSQGGMAYMASRDSRKPVTRVVSLLAFIFFCTFHAALFWVTVGMIFFLPGLDAAGEFKWLWLWIALDWPLFIIWIVFWQSRFKDRVPASLRESILFSFANAKTGLYFKIISLRAAQFLVVAFFIWMAMPGMMLDVPFKALLGILPIQGIIIALPTPGRYGLNEGAFLLLFRKWASEPGLVAFSLLWGTTTNIVRSLSSLIAVGKLKGGSHGNPA
jgi:hypothetical protein